MDYGLKCADFLYLDEEGDDPKGGFLRLRRGIK
jgi:hypothetical protein